MMKKTPRVPPLSVNLRTLAARHADPLARVSSQASSTMPAASSAAGSPRIPITARNVHLKLARGDLVAYEYLIDGKSPQWSWGLGTVVNVRGLRMVQLLPWQAREVTPVEANASAHDRTTTTTTAGGGKTGTQATDRATVAAAESQAAQQQQQKAQREKELHALEERQHELESEATALSSQLAVGEVSEHVVRSGLRSQIAQAAATLRHARYELTEVTEKEWRELRSYHSPPAVVELVLSATMVVLNEPNAKSWTGIQRVLRDANFLSRLQKLDPAQLPSQARRRLQIQYLQNPLFTYESAMHGSRALGALQQWVVASVQNNAALAELDERDRDAGSAATSAAHKAKEEQLAEIEARLQRCIVEADKLRLLILQAEIPTTTTTTKTEDDSSHGQKESQASQPKVRKAGSTPHSATPASARRDTSTASHGASPPSAASTTATTITNAAAAKMTEKDWNDFLLQMLQDNENDSSNSAGGGKSAKAKTPTLTPTVAEVLRHARHAWSLPTDNDDNKKDSNITRATTVGVITVLRSSILYNYTMPDALELTLAPRQVEQLVRAVRERSPSAAAEEQAAAQRLQEMQDELHELRAQLAQRRLSPPAPVVTAEDNNNRKEEETVQQQGDMQGKAKKQAAALPPPSSSPIHRNVGTDQSTATSEGVVLPAMTRTEATPATGQQGMKTTPVANTSPTAATTDKLSGVAAVGPSAMAAALPSPPQSTTRTSHTTDSESWPGVSPRGHSSGRVGEQPVNSSRHSARTNTPRGEQGNNNTNVTSTANVPTSPPASAAVSRALPDVMRALQEQVVTLRGHAASTGDVLQDLQRTIRTNAQLCAMMESV